MNAEIALLEVRSRRAWRAWLRKHHASSPGVWLIYYKSHAGIAGVEYDDSVCEALCFGWVDSLIKRLDDHRYVRKFTPRKPASNWSESNRKRWLEMKRARLLEPAGVAVGPPDGRFAPQPKIPQLPAYIAEALKEDPKAQKVFEGLPPSHRRQYVAWIHVAKKPETRERRIRETIAMLKGGKKLGIK